MRGEIVAVGGRFYKDTAPTALRCLRPGVERTSAGTRQIGERRSDHACRLGGQPGWAPARVSSLVNEIAAEVGFSIITEIRSAGVITDHERVEHPVPCARLSGLREAFRRQAALSHHPAGPEARGAAPRSLRVVLEEVGAGGGERRAQGVRLAMAGRL